jgi:hypothetical protein
VGEAPKITLERLPNRCGANCAAVAMGDPKPYLVKITMNKVAVDEVVRKTGQLPKAEQVVCTNMSCGGLMSALQALAPLQELVK